MSALGRAWRTLAFHRRRAVAAGLALSVSLALFAAMVQARQVARSQVDALEGEFGTLVEVRRAGTTGMGAGRDPLPASMGPWLASLPNATRVEPTLSRRLASSEGRIVSVAVGVQPGNPMRLATMGNLQTPPVVRGRGLEPGNDNASVAVVGQAFAEGRGVAVGDTFAVRNATLRVVGVFDSGTRFGDHQLFMPLNTTRRIFDVEGGVSQFFVTARTVGAVPGLADRIDREAPEDVDVVRGQAVVAQARRTLRAASAQAALAAVLSGAVAVAVAAAFSALLIRARFREVGVMKALGASHRQVTGQLVAEVAIWGQVSGVVAVAVAAVVGPWLVGLAVSSPSGAATGLGAAGVAGLLVGVGLAVVAGSAYPVLRAVRTPPAEAIRGGPR